MSDPGTERARRPVLSLWKKLLFSLITIAFLAAAGECVARFRHGWQRSWVDCHRDHPALAWSLRENWAGDMSWTGGPCRINAQGIRDDLDVGRKAPAEKRLLALGDSITFGARVSTAESWPARLQHDLQTRGASSWRILNGAVTSYDPAQEADWLELFGWGMQPDMIAVALCRNDVNPSDRTNRFHEPRIACALRWLTDHSLLAFKFQRLAWRLQAWHGVNPSLPRAPADDHGAPTIEDRPSGWPLIEGSYRKMARSAAARGVPVVLIIFPSRDVLEGNTRDDLSARLHELGGELGWPIIDLAPAFRQHAASLFFVDDPIHPNPAGYQRAAASLAEQLISRHLLP